MKLITHKSDSGTGDLFMILCTVIIHYSITTDDGVARDCRDDDESGYGRVQKHLRNTTCVLMRQAINLSKRAAPLHQQALT